MSDEMSDDELRAAAELVVEHCVAVPNAGRDLTAFEDAAFAVVTAWQVEHPPDDGEPVTADWLKTIGAEETIPGYEWVIIFDDLNPAITLTRQDRCWSAELGHGDFSSGNWPHDIVQRKQVRLMCAALGIPLTESPPCPTPSQSSETGPAGGSGATGSTGANC